MNPPLDRDRLIALSLLPFLTPMRTRRLLEALASATSACDAPSNWLQGLLSLNPEQATRLKHSLTTAEGAAALRERVLTLRDDAYPSLLREIYDPPLVLHVRGDPSLLATPMVAVVGSRRASPYAVNAAKSLTRPLVQAGLTIVSGLARGVDAAAHEAALDAGGRTVAVLGNGIDLVYPRANARLFERIAKEGLLVSELPPGSPPKQEHFPVRNRIISGLTYGTVIVEASRRSGSLITARMAAEQGREVFAVPGPIFAEGSEGTHRLIQYGAKLVHDANDILEELPRHLRLTQPTAEAFTPPASPLAEVLNAFSHSEAVHVDDAAAKLGRSPAALAEALLQLELGGWLRALSGARFIRAR